MPSSWLNVPHFQQEHEYSCVAACVRRVLAHFGESRTEAELRSLLDTQPTGTRAGNVMRLSGTLGHGLLTVPPGRDRRSPSPRRGDLQSPSGHGQETVPQHVWADQPRLARTGTSRPTRPWLTVGLQR